MKNGILLITLAMTIGCASMQTRPGTEMTMTCRDAHCPPTWVMQIVATNYREARSLEYHPRFSQTELLRKLFELMQCTTEQGWRLEETPADMRRLIPKEYTTTMLRSGDGNTSWIVVFDPAGTIIFVPAENPV